MTLRRYAPIAPSRGTVIPAAVRLEVLFRDGGCVGFRLSWPGDCSGRLELDHVRPGGMGMKSRSTADNLASLCSAHHRLRTLEGRKYRPLLLAYLDSVSR